jgi:hypothetical protein
MKLEFLAEGSLDCPLIRLYAFDQSAALRLRDLVNELATHARTGASLHEQLWIEQVKGCQLELRLDKRNRGVIQLAPLRFEFALSDEGWADVVGLLGPFCETHNPSRYQWLNEIGKISLLISPSGTW